MTPYTSVLLMEHLCGVSREAEALTPPPLYWYKYVMNGCPAPQTSTHLPR
jgi:hypothetical protein